MFDGPLLHALHHAYLTWNQSLSPDSSSSQSVDTWAAILSELTDVFHQRKLGKTTISSIHADMKKMFEFRQSIMETGN
jgi:hypothetical protein